VIEQNQKSQPLASWKKKRRQKEKEVKVSEA
jgi:hypothetical protein